MAEESTGTVGASWCVRVAARLMMMRLSTVGMGALLVMAGIDKTLNPAPLLGKLIDLTAGMSFALPLHRAVFALAIAEVAVGLLVLGRRWTGGVPVIAATVVGGFLLWDLARYYSGDEPDCGCTGLIRLGTWWSVAIKDLVLLSICAVHYQRCRVRDV